MVAITTIMMITVFMLLCVKSLDTHKNRLRFLNMYLFGVVTFYNCWYAFVIFNEFWISAPYIMCKETKNNPPPLNTPAFDECMQTIKNHTTADLFINLSLGLYLTYIIKCWADLKRDDLYENELVQLESDEKCCCFPISSGVVLILGY